MDIDHLLDLQDGVISRRQALAAGWTATDVARKLRRHEWTPVHPGVYVNHTGPQTWRQRAWAAVLACWPAALAGASARRAHEGPGRPGADDGPIEIVVAHSRRVTVPDGVRVRRLRRMRDAVQWNLSPPRMRYEDAIIDLADRAPTDLRSIAVLADACGGRRTTADRLRARLDSLAWLHRRDWLAGVLDDIAEGTCSVLEHGYLTLVERPHGLPRGLRQVEAVAPDGRRMFRDVLYGGKRPRWRQVVELDGRLGHSSAEERDRDLERDLDAAVDDVDTVRLGYRLVFATSCATAFTMARLLRRRGWPGTPHACPTCPHDLNWGAFDEAG
ncbi:MAG TPA: type IV toxin-antitoxin system AbiEi family antitoxin domain-containing protein [Nocardioides sp.]|nr:type IV toxin-antitoxin system AbiEi family antitoxin domain-containing protein [Nocardioides sp.]